ncbi:unnamed protein product [Adineta ricciae]|uniref:PHD-type domain-containing protein n=1 Tax=Adineta ricciae TaxID=249248 RepID=A0A813NAU5_ADIRI|nr:unnamed protein product [Adineta ricciae]CAF0961863.1 unnamed protein product [Adineta ricciae]
MMDDDSSDDSTFIDPEILKKELVISLPVLTESDIERMLNVDDSSTEESSTSTDEFDKDKFCPKRDQRRLSLLNDPNYGIILAFIEKFRSHVNFKSYPLRIFEDNLISEHEKYTARYIDFHLHLLKKISSGKMIPRDQFEISMKRFAYRFNRDDGDYVEEHGYAKAKVEIKLRILKNLLEKQFDRNQPMNRSLANKSSADLSSKPFGRDRLGASYWLFTDTDSYIRLFREDIDTKRTWINVAKTPQELESLLKILVTDYQVREKFPDWEFAHALFNLLTPSSVFEEHYSANSFCERTKQEISTQRSPSSIRIGSVYIKSENIDLNPMVSLDRELPPSPLLQSPKTTNFFETTSDQESINSDEINPNRTVTSPSSSSGDTRDSIYSVGCSQELNRSHPTNEEIDKAIKVQNPSVNDEVVQAVMVKPILDSGIKRKLVDYDDSESESPSQNKSETDDKHEDESSQDLRSIPVKTVNKNNADLPIALRRPRRNRARLFAELSQDSSSTNQSLSQSSIRTRSMSREWKSYNNSSNTNRSRRRRQRRRRQRNSMTGFSSTTSDDRQASDDDDDDFSQDFLNEEIDLLLNGDLNGEEDDDDDYIPCQAAKTVAKCYNQSESSSKLCYVCSETNRPENLLLCEDCNDAYHIECLKPELLAVPNDDWYCPLCEHKRLCDSLIEKLPELFKDQERYEMKRKVTASKRRKRSTNIAVNVERCIKPPVRRRCVNIITSSDDTENDNEKAIEQSKSNPIQRQKDEDAADNINEHKNDENCQPKDQEEEKEEQPGKRRVRLCRRKTQNYSLDEYDKKFEDVLVNTETNKDLSNNDSDKSDEVVKKMKSAKKRPRHECGEDLDATDSKHDADFVPSPKRTNKDDSRSNAKDDGNDNDDDYNDFGMSDDDSVWRNRRQSSASSISKKKSTPKSNCNISQKSPSISDDDTIIYGDTLSNSSPAPVVKSEPFTQSDTNERIRNPFDINSIGQNILSTSEIGPNLFDKNRFGKNVFGISEIGQNITDKTDGDKKKAANASKPKRQRRAPPKKKKLLQQENISDEEEKTAPPLPKHRPSRKRRDSDESSLDDDDDYEKLIHKRRLVNQGRNITRKSISAHIQKLVGEEEDEDEDENDQDSVQDKNTDKAKTDKNNNSKKANQNSEYEDIQLSDDDDFPDDQEILKTTGLINLKRPLTTSQAASFRVPYMPKIQSYQFTMVDPTAHFDFTCQPEPLSDASQANGETNLSSVT